MVDKYVGDGLSILVDYQYVAPEGGSAKLYVRFVGYSDNWFLVAVLTFATTISTKRAAIGTSIKLPKDMPLGTYDLQFMIWSGWFTTVVVDKPGELRIVKLTRPALSATAIWFENALLANASSVQALDRAMETFLTDPDLRMSWDTLSVPEEEYIVGLYQYRRRIL